jgi:hypothetical protein
MSQINDRVVHFLDGVYQYLLIAKGLDNLLATSVVLLFACAFNTRAQVKDNAFDTIG